MKINVFIMGTRMKKLVPQKLHYCPGKVYITFVVGYIVKNVGVVSVTPIKSILDEIFRH